MANTQNGYCVFNLTDLVVARLAPTLPVIVPNPDNPKGRLASFDQVNQQVEHNGKTYVLKEYWTVDRPSQFHKAGTSSMSNLPPNGALFDAGWVADVVSAEASAKKRIMNWASNQMIETIVKNGDVGAVRGVYSDTIDEVEAVVAGAGTDDQKLIDIWDIVS